MTCGPCPEGYSGDGIHCVEIEDPCSSNPCFENVTCTVVDDGFKCGYCPAGMRGDGVNCKNSPCASNPCYPLVVCADVDEETFR